MKEKDLRFLLAGRIYWLQIFPYLTFGVIGLVSGAFLPAGCFLTIWNRFFGLLNKLPISNGLSIGQEWFFLILMLVVGMALVTALLPRFMLYFSGRQLVHVRRDCISVWRGHIPPNPNNNTDPTHFQRKHVDGIELNDEHQGLQIRHGVNGRIATRFGERLQPEKSQEIFNTIMQHFPEWHISSNLGAPDKFQ